MIQYHLHRTRGDVLLMAIIFMGIFLTTFAGFMNYITLYTRAEHTTVASAQALALAEAGVDEAIYQLNQNANYVGETNIALGNGTFTTSVSTVDTNTKRITATGYISNSTNPIATRIIKVSANNNRSVVLFRFSAQVGSNGATLANGSHVYGNLFSNGSISGGGTITGDATVAGGTQPTIDQQWTVQNGSFKLGDTSAHANLAESFISSTSTALDKVSLYVNKIGAPSDIIIEIVSDNSGSPSTNVLASGSMPASSITSVFGFTDAVLLSPPNLTANQKYWIIAVAPIDANNYYTWGDDTTNGYQNGTGKYSSNWNASHPIWNTIGADLDFKTYMGGTITSLSGITIGGNAWAHSLSNCTVNKSATYQIMSGCSIAGTSIQTTIDASPAAMAISDAQIANWESIASKGGVIQGSYTISNNKSPTLGPMEINGDLTVNGTIYLSGPVWVNGNITFGTNSSLIVAGSTGSSGAVLLADATGNTAAKGTIYLANNMTIAGNNNAGSYPLVLSTNTGSAAINMNNNASSVILYAAYGGVTVNNNATANEVSGYGLTLGNNSSVNYVNDLQNSSFSNGPTGGAWTYIPGTYVIVK